MIIKHDPFFHIVVDNFFDEDVANELAKDFFNYDDPRWFHYNNAIEKKKTINFWQYFPRCTYNEISNLCSKKFIDSIKEITGMNDLCPDIGLHGGGWHIHGRHDMLNVHKDYSIHPKLGLLRKLNLIIYLTPGWRPEWGGALELWSHDAERDLPLKSVTSVDCLFNRAILFDTTQNSWHGLPNPIQCPDNVYRQSIAVYYLTSATGIVDTRQRARFVPTEAQKNNKEIYDLCIARSI